MSNNHHTQHAFGEALTAALQNAPLGQLDQAITNLLAGALTFSQIRLATPTELTIATGAVTVTNSYHTIDTEADAASDDLDTISGGSVGDLLFIQAANTARTIVVRHNGGGTGNIRFGNAADQSLDETYKILAFLFDGTNWNYVGSISSGLSFAVLRDEKSTGTNGGASSAATWNARNLNTEVSDTGSIVSIAANQMTPVSGTFVMMANALAREAGQHRLRLFNVTGAASVDEGLNAQNTAAAALATMATLFTVFTANGTDAYRIDHYTTSAKATNGLGTAVGDGTNEVYLEILLIKVA